MKGNFKLTATASFERTWVALFSFFLVAMSLALLINNTKRVIISWYWIWLLNGIFLYESGKVSPPFIGFAVQLSILLPQHFRQPVAFGKIALGINSIMQAPTLLWEHRSTDETTAATAAAAVLVTHLGGERGTIYDVIVANTQDS